MTSILLKLITGLAGLGAVVAFLVYAFGVPPEVREQIQKMKSRAAGNDLMPEKLKAQIQKGTSTDNDETSGGLKGQVRKNAAGSNDQTSSGLKGQSNKPSATDEEIVDRLKDDFEKAANRAFNDPEGDEVGDATAIRTNPLLNR